MKEMTKKAPNAGYIKTWRKIWDNPISHKPNYLAVFLYIVSHANYQDKDIIWNNKRVTIKRGSFIGAISQIANHFGLSKGTVHYILEYLKAERMIERKATGSFTVFTVLNYDKYQEVERKSEHELNTNRTRIETTNNNKNNKNDKKESKEKELILKKEKKYSSIKDLGEEEFEKVANLYQVPLPFVRSCYDSLVNYCEAHGKRYKNYLAALRNFVKNDALKIKREVSERVSKKGIDARGVK